MKADKIIEKFGLREYRVIRGKEGHKMDEGCIDKFVSSDPSGTNKYLEWMLYQAGGGQSKLDRSVKQWHEGEHGEPSLRDQLRDCWIKVRMGHWKDDSGQEVMPATAEEAKTAWEAEEEAIKWYHVYGDEEYIEQGCFGFYRSWPGANNLYETIVDAVCRFHRHTQALKAKGWSADLSLKNYPNLPDLLMALREVSAAELKADVDYDMVYSDQWVQVYCPYNIGASLKFGISKWCTANETMFLSALSLEGKNRWKEHATDTALYYCHFRNFPTDSLVHTRHVAIQVAFAATDPKMAVTYAKYWDAEDKAHSLEEFLSAMSLSALTKLDHITSFRCAVNAIAQHFKEFKRDRMVVNFAP